MEEIINSVMQSPENTNPNVLRGQLQKIGGSSGGGTMVVNLHMEPGGDGKTVGMILVCDKTADEMFQAIETKSIVLKFEHPETAVVLYLHIIAASHTDGYTFIVYKLDGDRITFTSMTADGYPSSPAQ